MCVSVFESFNFIPFVCFVRSLVFVPFFLVSSCRILLSLLFVRNDDYYYYYYYDCGVAQRKK